MKKCSEFTEEEKQEMLNDRNEKKLTAKNLAEKYDTTESTIYQIFKLSKNKENQEAKDVIEQLLGNAENENKLPVVLPQIGIAEYHALFNLNTQQSEEIVKLENELKTSLEALNEIANESIEKDKEIENYKETINNLQEMLREILAENNSLKSRISELLKPKKELLVEVNVKNLDSYEQMRQLFMNLIFDSRIEKKIRQEYAFKVIEAERS